MNFNSNYTSNGSLMFGKLAPGMCRITMNGEIAVKCSGADGKAIYKAYNVETGRLTNCDNFVFDIGDDFFFAIPTNKVSIGDIIIQNGKPKCVIQVEKNQITVINYDSSTIEIIVPERHIFLGNAYFYGKIVSMFGNNLKGKNSTEKMMKFMMLSEMMKGANSSNGFAGMNNMLPMMLMMNSMGGDMSGMLDGMFDFGGDDCEDDVDVATINADADNSAGED